MKEKAALTAILLTSLLMGMFSEALNIQPLSASENTGFEPWYYYVNGLINSASGNLFFSTTDISIRARGFDIAIVRAYNSHHSNLDGPFGLGWTHNYNIRLKLNPDDSVTEYEEDGSVHTFTFAGGSNYVSPAGIHSKLTKGTNGFVLRFTNGRRYDFDSSGKLLSITDKNGNKLTLSYTDGKLARVEDDSSQRITLDYDGNRISRVVDPLGRTVGYEYEDGKLVKVTDPMGKSTLYFYHDNSKLKIIIDRLGRMLTFSYYASGKVEDIWSSMYQYSGKSYLNHFKVCHIEYEEKVAYATNSRGYTTTTQMNEFGNPTRITDPTGNFTVMNWDNDINMISYTDANRNTYFYEYGAFGHVKKLTDPSGNFSVLGWENIDDGTRYISLLENFTDELGHTTYYEYDVKANLNRTVDATRNSSSYFYDQYGYLRESRDPRGYSTHYSYDTHGFLISSADATGNITRFIHDGIGRLTSVTDANNNTVTYEHDNNDRCIKEIDAMGNATVYNYNAEDELLSVVDAEGRQTDYDRNILGGMETARDASGNATFYRYDREGNLIKKTDAGGYASVYTYDPLNRLTSVTDALGNTVSYAHDAVGNLLTVTDANGHVTRREYDKLNRLTRIISPLGNKIQFLYDAVENLIEKIDANGDKITYAYDELNRPVSTSYPDGSNCINQYDAVGNVIRTKNNGGLGDTTHYSYDEVDRLLSVTVDYGLFNKTVNYTYDPVGNRKTMRDADGKTTTYEYNARDDVIRIADPVGGATTFQYDKTGGRIRMNYPNGVYTVYQYDTVGRLLSLVTRKLNGDRILEYSYERDEMGNMLKMTEFGTATTSYGYDALSRLVNVTYPWGESVRYTYDARGNRLSEVVETEDTIRVTLYTYDDDDRLLIAGATNYTNDNNGNVISKIDANGITHYQCDYENRLTHITYPNGSSVAYQYSPAGERLSKKDNTTTYYFYGNYDYLAEYAKNGTQIAGYSQGPRTDEHISLTRNNVTYYYLVDGLDSVRAMVDQHGYVIDFYRYYAFGTPIRKEGVEEKIENPYRFAGKELDEETGLYHCWSAFYDSVVGRFIAGENLNTYANENPLGCLFASGYASTIYYDLESEAKKWARELQVTIYEAIQWVKWTRETTPIIIELQKLLIEALNTNDPLVILELLGKILQLVGQVLPSIFGKLVGYMSGVVQYIVNTLQAVPTYTEQLYNHYRGLRDGGTSFTSIMIDRRGGGSMMTSTISIELLQLFEARYMAEEAKKQGTGQKGGK